MNPENKRWITVREAAGYLGISLKGCYDLAAAGKLPSAKIGRLRRVALRALDAELERQVSGQAPAARTRRRGK